MWKLFKTSNVSNSTVKAAIYCNFPWQETELVVWKLHNLIVPSLLYVMSIVRRDWMCCSKHLLQSQVCFKHDVLSCSTMMREKETTMVDTQISPTRKLERTVWVPSSGSKQKSMAPEQLCRKPGLETSTGENTEASSETTLVPLIINKP